MIDSEDDAPGIFFLNVYRTFLATRMLHYGGPSDLPFAIWGRHLPLTGQWVAPLETTPLGTVRVEIVKGRRLCASRGAVCAISVGADSLT